MHYELRRYTIVLVNFNAEKCNKLKSYMWTRRVLQPTSRSSGISKAGATMWISCAETPASTSPASTAVSASATVSRPLSAAKKFSTASVTRSSSSMSSLIGDDRSEGGTDVGPFPDRAGASLTDLDRNPASSDPGGFGLDTTIVGQSDSGAGVPVILR